MKIEIDDDNLDGIIQGVLVENYVSVKDTLKNYKNKKQYLHEDDVKVYVKVLEALEVLGNWYFARNGFKNAVKAESKKK
jgi:hypothetical protein